MPAAKIITAAIIRIITAVPRSGSGRISATIAATTTPIGNSVEGASAMRSIRRSRSAATNTMTAIFANSDGWMPSPQMPIQRLAPLTGRRKSTATRPRPTTASAVQITTGCR